MADKKTESRNPSKRPPRDPEDLRMKRATRRSFIVGGLSALAGYWAWRWLVTRRPDNGIPWPLRRVLDVNGDISQDYYRSSRLEPSIAPVRGKEPRFNGDVGLGGTIDLAAWRLKVISPYMMQEDEEEPGGKGPSSSEKVLSLTMKDILALPKVEESIRFKCIEGWKDDVSVAGVRFSDFMKHYGVGRSQMTGRLLPYVGLETPDGKYYVSLDMPSMMHPQTLLCYEMNGMPISAGEGAPLRLIIPIKYGIKSLKRIGVIRFSEARPRDYWAERGYDWYAGL